MPETFAPFTWIDGAGGGTPITAAQLNRLETGLESMDDRAAALELGALTPVPVTYSASLTINAAQGALFRVVATGNLTLAAITGGANGQLISLEVRASEADRTLTVAGDAVVIPVGQRWWGDFRYDSGTDEWTLRTGDSGGSGAVADGSLALAKLATSGTRSAETFLRGDGAWTEVSSAGSSQTLYARGLNLAGGEFAHTAATLPGIYGTDYSYDSADALAAIAARGHTLIRLPFRWERIQPTRGAALNTTELARLQTFVANAHGVGMQVALDVHNYARYIDSSANGGLERVLGTANLPVSSLVDLWTRLSTAFKDNPGVYAYGLMNEPHDLVAVAGGFSGTARYDWSDGVQGWTGDTATASVVSGRLRLSGTATTGFFQFRKDDTGLKRGGALSGSVLEAVVTLGAGITGDWRALLQWQNSSFQWQSAATTTYTRVDTGAVVGGLVAGVAVRVRASHAAITTPNAFAIQIEANNATAGAVSADIDDFTQGSVTGGMSAAQVWEDATQQLVTAIRGNGDDTLVLVPGYAYSGAKPWPTNHPTPWITGGGDIAYEAHYYFDVDNSGDYPDNYATENAAAVSAGHASLAARATSELGNWTTWLDSNGVKGFLGEVGWPNTADTTSWNAVGEAIYDLCDTRRVDVTYWAGGARWGTGYNLSLYTGANQGTVKAQAAVVESHPTTYQDLSGQVTDLAGRVTVLETSGVGGGGVVTQGAPYIGPAFMVIDAEDAGELATAKTNGATHALVQVKWDQHQSVLNGAVDATTVLERINTAVTAGLKVCLRVSPQYIPTFVDSGGVKFKRASGTEHNPGNPSGYNVRDWIWSKSTRAMVEDFLGKLFAQLDWSKIERVQVGGGPAGELQYPLSDFASNPNVPYWWAYSTPAQSGGSDLAPRMSACPVPGHTVSTGTTWTDNDEKFVGWYTQSLNNWMIWLIEQHRRFFTGPIWVMHPGFGLRRNSMTPTGSNALQYRMQVASGLDWAAQIGAYPDADCHPYSTWADGTHPWDPAPYSEVNDGNAAAWLHLLRVSRSLGRAGRIWGENTAVNSGNDVMDRVFREHAVAHGYEGVTWLNHDGLANGATDTYANFASRTAEVTAAQIDHQPPVGGSSGSSSAVASVNGQTGAVVLDADDLVDGTANHVFTAADDTKLSGIATGATANASDAALRARSSHTGTQALSTLATTGTASSSTYLRGDGAWANPSGSGGAFLNVKDYGAVGNGTADDAAGIQAAINAAESTGGTVYLPAGTYRVTASIVVPSGVHLRGSGIGGDIFSATDGTLPYRGTVIRLANTANVDVIRTKNFATNTGVDSPPIAGIPSRFGIHDLVIDGNRANNTSGWCARLYGLTYIIHNVIFQNGRSGGVWSESRQGGYEMEAKWTNFAITDCSGTGLEWRGPHDSMFTNGIVARNDGFVGINIGPNGWIGGEVWTNIHVWGGHTYQWSINASNQSMVNCQSDGGGIRLINAQSVQWIGGAIFGDGTAGKAAITLGDGTTTSWASGNRFITRVFLFPPGSAIFHNRTNSTFGWNEWQISLNSGASVHFAGEGHSATTGSVTLPVTSLALANASSFSTSGQVVIGDPVAFTDAVLTYTGKTGDTLTGVTGGTGTYPSGSHVWQVGAATSIDSMTVVDPEKPNASGIYHTVPGITRTGRGATGSRPSASVAGSGAQWYDTTLGKPIWSNGSVWRDASGTTV